MKLVSVLSMLLFAGVALADDLTESFPDPLGGYQSRWFYQNTNVGSYYVATGDCNIDNRGNNPCGLWFTDCQGCSCGVGGNTATIQFNSQFGSTISLLEFDYSGFNGTRIEVLDMSGAAVLDIAPQNTQNVCAGVRVSAGSNNGVSAIRFTGSGQVEGNNAIDNVHAVTGPTCNGTEFIKKAKCKVKNGAVKKAIVLVSNATDGQDYTCDLNTGQSLTQAANNGKVKFKFSGDNAPPCGENAATVCGQTEAFECLCQ